MELYKIIDTIWMISHAVQLPDVPMWVGFNSLLSDNNSAKHIVSYLTPINESQISSFGDNETKSENL